MNPLLEEEENEREVVRPWRNKNRSTSVKALGPPQKKPKLSLTKSQPVRGREDIDRILENYDFQRLHDRIMKRILD